MPASLHSPALPVIPRWRNVPPGAPRRPVVWVAPADGRPMWLDHINPPEPVTPPQPPIPTPDIDQPPPISDPPSPGQTRPMQDPPSTPVPPSPAS